ncbi:hypothetical protein GCM10022297_01900 [Lactobacillus hamsteri]|uniref:Tropomyosin n=1 Tax=Lactobacillus hamsteri DSM 5661 = JCM 6256 TaxID=1423754 RepID=A0A0R1Y777_9LACO|nr:hypothetical protein [Lactobacillus hamsteri]KRM37933.1 hypothetical protein FC39_GL001507 [Lactobacillus hamsteri DSM 5661 = JCM 6256]
MNKFGLGLFLGATAGFVLSLLKDENGNRFGKQLKEDVQGMEDAAGSLADGINKAKKASQDLQLAMPAAQRAINDISDDVANYQTHTANIMENIEYQAKKISEADSDSKKN